jgi:hypothetical protein
VKFEKEVYEFALDVVEAFGPCDIGCDVDEGYSKEPCVVCKGERILKIIRKRKRKRNETTRVRNARQRRQGIKV